eukprot:CAMPEP_0197516978 /NCGR_PEP_ID=MMETSP1318-20131121/1946_1 /TAXON_ID=552666 /ORGANISM="Partenskyella glossopodia, Strain RCC365" /LENGTH=146 /DNA_ID=CAMNT_0043066175 /DNA_START=229 /DNA_END=666 /DNA_ORIENTATION=+
MDWKKDVGIKNEDHASWQPPSPQANHVPRFFESSRSVETKPMKFAPENTIPAPRIELKHIISKKEASSTVDSGDRDVHAKITTKRQKKRQRRKAPSVDITPKLKKRPHHSIDHNVHDDADELLKQAMLNSLAYQNKTSIDEVPFAP